MSGVEIGKGRRRPTVILALAIFNYLLLSLLHPGGLMAYLLPSACWGVLAVLSVRASGLGRIRSWFKGRLFFLGFLAALSYLVLLLYVGILSGFGRSPYSFSPQGVTINALFVFSTLSGMEFSRAYLAKSLGGRRPFLVLGLLTLLYAFLGIPTAGLLHLQDSLAAIKFLGTGLLPSLAESLFATHLAFLGGPSASLAYRAPLTAFWWFCPLLPRLSWGVKALLGVMVPTLGFLAINLCIPSFTLRRLGLAPETGGFGKLRKPQVRGLILASILCVLLVWASTGLLGLRVTTILSGSMDPSLEVGDMVVVREVPASSVRPGDVIQFGSGGEAVVHRVVEVRQEGGNWFFITKGDANPSPDPTPVSSVQLMGKVVMQIPKLGWLAIGMKEAMVRLLSLVREHTLLALSLSLLLVSVFLRRRHRSSRVRWGWKGVSSWRGSSSLVFLLFFLAVSGIAYARWSEPLYVSGRLETGAWGSEIECYKLWSFPCGQVTSGLSEDNRTLYLHYKYTYPCDTVWVLLKLHNSKTVPVFFEGFPYQFSSPSLENCFHICEWFFGPYGDGCVQGGCWWWEDHLCGGGCDGPDGKTCWWMDSCCLRPPIQLDPCQSLIAVVKLKSYTCSWSDFTISMTIEDACWASKT